MMLNADFRPYDLFFPDQRLGLHLFREDPRARSVSGRYGQAQLGPNLETPFDLPRIWRSFAGGAGASHGANVRRDGVDALPDDLYAVGENVYTRDPYGALPAGQTTEVVLDAAAMGVTLSEVTAMAEQDGHLYLVAGRYVVRIANGTDVGPIITVEKDLGAGRLGDNMVAFEGALYVGVQDYSTLWKKPAGGAWTNLDPGTGLATTRGYRKLGVVFWALDEPGSGLYTAKMRLLGTDSATTFRHVSAGAEALTPGNWSSAIKVGNTSYPINSIVATNRHAYFCTAGGIADIDARGESPILNPAFRFGRDDTQNGAVSFYHDGYIYVNHRFGLQRFDVSSRVRDDDPDYCDVGQDLPNETEIYGRTTALCSEGGWLVQAKYNGRDSFVLVGKDRRAAERPGPGPLVWHGSEVTLRGERLTALQVSSPSGQNPRLWLATVTSGGAVKLRWEMLLPGAGPIQELLNNLDANGLYTGAYRWAGTWKLTLAGENWEDDAARKIMVRYDGRADRLNEQTYLRLFASAEGSAYVQQGSGADPKMTTSPRAQLVPTEPLVRGHNIMLRLEGTNPATAPPILRALRARADAVQENRDSRQYLVSLGPAKTLRNAARDSQDPGEVWAALVALHKAGPVSMEDEMGVPRRVKVEANLGYREHVFQRAGSAGYERHLVADVIVTLMPTTPEELALDGSTSPPAVVAGARYDSGLRYDSGVRYDAPVAS